MIILLILQLETDYSSSLFISEKFHSKQWHYGLHRDFQKLHSTHSTRRSPTGFFKPRIQFYMQKTKSSSNTLQNLPKAFQPQDLTRAIWTFQSFMTFSLSRQILHSSSAYSILQLECIFYILTGLHRNSTEYQLGHYYKLQTFKEREMLHYRSKWTHIPE